jgi:hypothetical protein
MITPQLCSLLLPWASLLAPSAVPSQAESTESQGFAEVRGILESRCLTCHGGEHRKSGFSVASAETFQAGGSRGAVVRAGEFEKSRLLEVIEYGNPELAMPPSGALPNDEVQVLRSWILDGAQWPEGLDGRLADPEQHPLEEHRATADASWWAYGPLQEQESRKSGGADEPNHPVDQHIYAGLEAAGYAPAKRATPATLLRRASFSLTGLPPSAAERKAFLADVEERGFDSAWSSLLDRLFASPHYGEAQARHWLDLVRYAETDGYERDSQKKNIWRYRDWVVRALGGDMPYDQFVQWQLAGDEFASDLDDPFEVAEAHIATGFYRVGLFDDEPADRLQAVSDDRADIVDTVSQVIFGTTMGCARCHDHKADPITQKEYFALTAHFTGVTRYSKNGHRPFADRPGDGIWEVPAHEARLAELEGWLGIEAAQLGIGKTIDVPEVTEYVRTAEADANPWRYRFLGEPTDDGWQAPAFDDAEWSAGPAGFGTHGTPGAKIGTVWNGPRVQLRQTFRLTEIPESLQLRYHHDDDLKVYLNGQLIFERAGYITKYQDHQLDATAISALVVGRNVLCVECSQDFGGQYVDVGLSNRWDFAAPGGLLEAVRRTLASPATESHDDLARLFALRERHLAEPTARPYPAHVVYEEGATPPRQFVEMRGSAHAPGDEVEPALPNAWLVGASPDAPEYALPSPDAASPSSLRRRALSEWAFDQGSHITSRVAANRAWQFLFGRGLCRSSGDFGRLGESPTHAALLDAVAAELVARDWSLQSLQRWLMESRTYQSSTERSARAVEGDPRNDLYAGFDPRRLTAEEFRDAALATSGELNPERFGPWVYPPLAKEVLATSSQPNNAWGQSTAEDALRRSLYVHVKRSLREPLLAVLDQPDPDLSCAVRFPTNVPTQALLTLNGAFVNKRASALASGVLSRTDGPDAVRAAIEQVLGREADPDEIQRGTSLLNELTQEMELPLEDAMQLFTLGLFNRNEFIWID